MKAEMIKEVLEKYTGQKIRVVYITSTKAYWQEGILQAYREHSYFPKGDGIEIKIEVKQEGYPYDSGIRHIHKQKILQIITADGKVWETPAKEEWACSHCGYKTKKQPQSKSGSFTRCPKCGGMMQGRFKREPQEVKG